MTAGTPARPSLRGFVLLGFTALVLGLAAGLAGAAGAATWKRDREPPSMPANLRAASATSSAITYSWSASTDNVGVAGYDVYVGSAGAVRVTTLSHTVTGLPCGTSVSEKVFAVDRAGNRSPAATAVGSTTDCGDQEPPTAPTGLSVTARSDTSVTLSWAASTDNVGVVGYRYSLGLDEVGTTANANAVFTGLRCAATYTLAVAAFDASGNTSTKASTSATTAPCTSGTGEPAAVAGLGYRQVFRDDFDTLNRSVWDDHIWYDEVPRPAWTTFQYTQNGILHLLTSRNFFWGTGPNDNYPMNTITTQTSGRTFQQGYFEARMKWSAGHGAWPGFWLYSYRHATNPAWPSLNPYCSQNGLSAALCYSAELDVFEGQGSEARSFYGTIHRNSSNTYGVADQQNANNWRDAGVDLTAGFHTYGMLWTGTQITWYLDDRALMSAPVYDSTNQPMFLLLQMWTGGWTYDPDSTTPTDIETQVDYVQVWQR